MKRIKDVKILKCYLQRLLEDEGAETKSFEEAELLTNDEGLVLTRNGEGFLITITKK